MATFEDAFASIGRRFDDLRELTSSDRAMLLADALQVLERTLTIARERNAGKRVAADARASETTNNIVALLAEKVYRRRDDIREVFLRFDMGDGKISLSDLRFALRSMQITVSDDQLVDVMRVFDTDDSGAVDYEEFVTAVEDAAFLSRDEASSFTRSLRDAARSAPHRSARPASAPVASAPSWGELERDLAGLRRHVWTKHGTASAAWRAYHPHSRRPEAKLTAIAAALRREGFPVPMDRLRAMAEVHGLEGASLDFSQFRLLVTADPGMAEEASVAMGTSGRREARARPQAPDSPATYRDYEAADPLAGTGRRFSASGLLEHVGDALARTSYSSRKLHKAMTATGARGCPPHDLRRGLHRIGCEISEAEAALLVGTFDGDGDGQLSFREFLALVRAAADALAAAN